MSEPRTLTPRNLRDIVLDADELAKGTKVFDDGGLAHLARFEYKLFAEAKGSAGAPYKVQILFEERGVRGRCSCMAARSRPFCKHAAAVLVAWARAPGAFAEAPAPPPGLADGAPRKKAVKTGKVAAADLMGRGVDQVSTLVLELAVAGVAALAADRVDQVRALGAALREAKLRRLSAHTLELAEHLGRAAARTGAFDPSEYAELLGDVLLTARKLEKHLAGEPLAPEHVEELIGKTWTKKDRQPVAGLELLEYCFLTRFTSDEYVIRESRFIDLSSGEHFSEKQILPAFLAKRTPPKPSWAGRVLAGAAGSLYPSFAPRRLDLDQPGAEVPLDHEALARLLARALPAAGAALAALQERRKDVFAPETLPVALRADTVLAQGARLQLVDGDGAALYLPGEGEPAEELARALAGVRLAALLGDVALDGALPTLFPLAAVVEARGRLALVPLARRDAAAVLQGKKLRAQGPSEDGARAARWVEIARAAGVAGAAIALGEVREEMAQALANGLGAVVPRLAEPLCTRLGELGLAKPAELLRAVAGRPDPAEKLDDFVKLHQVLGIALARLAGAAHVDRAAVEPAPGHPSVVVKRPEQPLVPREVAALQGAGTINRFEAAVHYARYYGALPPEVLAQAIYPTWADGSATPFVVAALARAPGAAFPAARRVLEPEGAKTAWGERRATARVARLTAIRVLAALANPDARRLLRDCARRRDLDPALAAHAGRALATLTGDPEPLATARRRDELAYASLNASTKEDRIAAVRELADGAFVEAIPVVRASFAGDVSRDVRAEAAAALARLGDVDSVDAFVRMLRDRRTDPADAMTAARVLGTLGDVRGLDELLRAWSEGWHPGVVAEAMRAIGPAALEPVVAHLEHHPELAERKAALAVIGALPADEVAGLLGARVAACPDGDDFCPRAALYMAMASEHPTVATALARQILARRPALAGGAKLTREERTLAKRCAKCCD